MNKIYRAIWNETTQTWVAASELAKSKTKSDTVSSLPATGIVSRKSRFSSIFKLSLVASVLNMSLLIPNSYASNAGFVGGKNVGNNGADQPLYPGEASHGTVILAGSGDACGADEVAGRGKPGRAIVGTEISALEEYLRFAKDQPFGGKNPYGTTTISVAGTTAAQQGTLTQSNPNKLPVAYGVYSFASGCGSYTSGNYSTAFGTNATATAGGAMAIGTAALASGRASIAFGVSAQATGLSSVALGSVASSEGVGSVAAGLMSQASADGTVALGVQAKAKEHSAIAIGNSAQATGQQGISIGSANNVTGKASGAIGGSEATTLYNKTDGTQTTAASGATIVAGDNTYSFGNQNGTITADNTGIFGNQNKIETDPAGSIKANDIRILGNNNTVSANGTGAMIVGNAANVSAANALALGNSTQISGANGVAIGYNANASIDDGVALGRDSVASTKKGVTGYDPVTGTQAKDVTSSAWNSKAGSVAVGNGSTVTRQITGLAAGTLDTDAVNVAQLKSAQSFVSSSLSTLTDSTSTSIFKLNSSLSSLNTSTSTYINNTEQNYQTLSTSVDNRFSIADTNYNNLSTATATNISILQEDALQWNKEQQAYDASHLGKGPAKILNVADGNINAPGSTDAVNGGQLYATNLSLSTLSSTSMGSISSAVLKFETVSGSVSSILSSTTEKFSQLSTATASSITQLNRDALQLKNGIYDASRDGQAQKITNIAAGDTSSATSTDVVNGGQLFATNSDINSLSTMTSTSLRDADNKRVSVSLSVSNAIGITNKAISSLAISTSDSIAHLSDVTLQLKGDVYDASYAGTNRKVTNVAAADISKATSSDLVIGGQLYTTNKNLDNLTSTTAEQLSKAGSDLTSISTGIDSNIKTVSKQLTDNINTTVTDTTNKLNTVSTNLSNLQNSASTSIKDLRSNALQWENNAFSASRGNTPQKITQVAAGDITSSASTDAVNGSQLYTTNSNLTNLSTTFNTELGKLSDKINASSSADISKLSDMAKDINTQATSLQNNALLWNDSTGAYDASHGGNPGRITNVLSGSIAQGSTDVITGGQLFSLSTATETKLQDVTNSLNTGLTNSKSQIDDVRKQALLWNQSKTAYDASNQQNGTEQKITGVAAGDISAPNSSDVVIGAQLYTTNSVLNSLSSSTLSNMNSLSTALDSTSKSMLDKFNNDVQSSQNDITALKNNALQWNSNVNAYDAKNQRITNVKDGDLGESSTDVVTGKQLYSISSSTESSLQSLSSSLDGLSATGLKKLSTALSDGLSSARSDIGGLQQDALQWKDGAYDASHGVKNGTQRITNVKDGDLSGTSSDVVTGKQLYDTNNDVSNLSSSLTTKLQNLTSSTSSSLDALSTDLNKSLNSSLGSLSSAVDNRLTSTNASLNTLQKNALQWNGKAYDASHGVEGGKERITNVDDAVLLQGSSDVVTGGQLYNTNTTVSSLSTTLDRGIKSISTSTDTRLTALSDNLNKSLSSKMNELSSTLDNGLNQADTSIRLLQKNALQWNGKAYDASHGVTGGQEVITNVADADLSPNSSDVVTGGQLFDTNSQLSNLSGTVDRSINSLSLSTSTGVSSLSTALYEAAGKQINSLSTSFDQQLTAAKSSVTSLQQNALLWNNDLNNGKGAYDATHNGQAQRITNVLNGSVQASSSDVVTGDQLFTTNSNLGTLSGSVSTTFSSLSNSLSDINSDKLTELSGKLQSTNDELSNLSKTTSLSLKNANTNLGLLQQNALLWNNELNNGKGAYDASHNGIYQRITNVADADLSPDSSDAVTGGQLYKTNAKVSNLSNTIGSVSNSVVNGLSSLSSSLTEISNNNLSSLSTGLNETRNRLTDLSESTSSSLKVTGSKIKSLQQNALLWNDDIDAYNAGHGIANMPGKITNVADGVIKEGSSDVATAGQLYTTNTAISSLSTNVSSGFDNLSTSLSTIAKAGGISSLSTVTETVSSKVTQLQQNALQYNNEPGVGGYDASRATGKPQKITRVAEGNISDTSSDVITGSQLYAVNTEYSAGLNSVSKSVSTGLTSVQDKLNSLSNDWPEKFNSLSNSASTGLGNLSTIVSTSVSSLSVSTSGSVASLSTSTSTGLSSLSVSASNQIASLSTSTSSGLNNLSASTSTVLGKLGNTVSTAASNVAGLQKDALQWSEEAGAYSANHGTGNAQRITNVAAGNVAPDSSDAINGSQFFQLSSSTSTGLSSLSTNLSAITNNQLGSLSTIVDNNLNTVNQNVSSLSTGLNTVTEKVTALQTDALQWDKVNGNYKADHGTGNAQKITQVAAGSIAANSTDAVNGAQMYSLSTGTADSVNKLTENLNKTNLGLGSLSTATNTDLKNLKDSLKSTNDGLTQLSSSTSGSIQSISTSLDTLTTSTANSLQALDKGLKDTSSSVSTLQANALQWNAGKGVYDASRDGSAKVLSGVAAGAVSAESTEAVNGGQLHSLSTVTVAGMNSISTGLSSLSESTTTGLNNLTNSLNSTNQTLTTLQANTLQWKGSAYDAGHNGTAQRITNVAAGNIALDSTDAVNGGQLFSLSGSTSTGLSSLSTNLSTVTNNQLGSLSSIISNSLSTVNQNVSSLSTSLNDTNTNVAELRQNALQWNGVSSAYDATRSGRAQKLTGIAGGDISATSSDAVNGAQMYSLSTLTQKGLGSISTGLSNLSSVTSSSLDNVNRSLESLSTETHTGLNSVSTGLSSLSQSTTTGLNNLSASLSSANQNLTTLQQNALQWNNTLTAYDAGHNGTAQRITNVAAGNIALDSTDAVNGGQLFSLSSSTSTGLSSLSTNLSKVTDNQLGSLSTIIGDNLNTVNQNVSSLSTSLNDTNTNVGNLQKDALQWNSTISAYDATRGGRAQTLTGIAGGDISATSSDAVNGAQMYSLSTLTQTGLSSSSTGLSSLSSVTSSALDNVNRSLESLSTETHTGLNSVSTGLSSLSQSTTTGLNNLSASLSSTNQNLTTLQQNALQWNSTLTAYDAGHNGIAQRITNVAAGRIAADSTDAVNGGQLFSLSGSTSTGLS
ncbi:hypothetical protein BGI05_01575, partial [Snodgrassella alvi]